MTLYSKNLVSIMKHIKFILIALFVVLSAEATRLYAQDSTAAAKTKKGNSHKKEFVDKNGDGYNDNAPDDDGDGIPNGLDPDYKRMKKRMRNANLPFVDLNGDGINDNLQVKGKGQQMRWGENNSKVKPQDGNNSPSNPETNEKQKGKRKGAEG